MLCSVHTARLHNRSNCSWKNWQQNMYNVILQFTRSAVVNTFTFPTRFLKCKLLTLCNRCKHYCSFQPSITMFSYHCHNTVDMSLCVTHHIVKLEVAYQHTATRRGGDPAMVTMPKYWRHPYFYWFEWVRRPYRLTSELCVWPRALSIWLKITFCIIYMI